MAAVAGAKSRILPCLLDRLTDHYPRARKEGRQHRVVTLRQYRDSVMRDLAWLLNCTSHPAEGELAGFEYVQQSVLNYGVKCLSGVWASNRRARDIEEQVRQAILLYEPRIVADSLEVKLRMVQGMIQDHSVVTLEISGELWARPIPEQLFIRTELDLETGMCDVSGT